MGSGKSQSALLLEKIREQVSLAQHLVSLVPPSALEWRPGLAVRTAPAQVSDRCNTANARAPGKDPAGEGLVETDGSELMRTGDLLGHMLECLAGFCALLYSIKAPQLAHFGKLRDLEVNHFCGVEEARIRFREYLAHIEEGFALLDDQDLCRLQPTVFVPEGEPVLTLILGNLEHLINHKHQLFIYLRLLGMPVRTKHLYRFRGE